MELKQIKELMQAMRRFGLVRVALKQKDFEIELEAAQGRPVEMAEPMYASSVEPPMVASPMQAAPMATKPAGDEGHFIRSPFVGSFYTAPGPEAPAFCKVGDRVSEETVVCIVEAMKVMNEIRAGVAGTITEVLIENGQPVEFGTKLFRITPA
jgi:acetyl-CoA carboxylase biotin carboxyl carrier protein